MGNEESHPYKHVSLKIKGMDCPDCAQTIQKNISLMPRVRNVRLDFDMAILEADVSGKTGKDDIEAAIRSLGYAIQKAEPFPFLQKNRKSILTFLSGVLAIGGVTLSYLDFSSEAVIGVYGLSIIIGGYHIARKGIVSLKLLTFDMNLLMSVAVLGACILGEWLEGASVVFLFSLAQLLESYSADKARNAIKSLLNLAPPSSLVRRNGEERVVPACDVEVGETMIIRPGERVALDGLIFKGFSHVNQSPVTGESMPQEKKEGDRIFAGSFNIDGVLEAKVTAPSHNTTLARIIALVEKSHAKKAPMVSYVERFARIYTPAVIGVALFMAVVPPLIFGEARVWFYRSLVLLVISCPCALVISTPVTIVSGLASGARHGILVKGGLSLERMGSVDVIAFDKTGTLTHGQPSLTDIVASPGFSEEEVLSISASCEHHSEHPLGIAVVRRAQEMGLPLLETEEFSVHPGKGIRAKIDGKRALLGNERFIESEGIKPYPLKEEAVRLSGEGKTIVFLGMGERLAGILAFADTLKENAHKTVEELKGLMVDVIVLSGDNAKTAETIAIQAGIDHVRAGIHPEDKASEIKRLQSEGKKVAMVGDGINDAPALAQADVGIAMGALGSDVAIETADIALMTDDLSKIAYVMTLSKKTTGIIKENIIFALLTKAVFFILALAGVATLWSAVFADMGASLIVIANGLRLLQWKG